jgi:hypothetical protein
VFPVGPLLLLSLLILIASGWFRPSLAQLGLSPAGALLILGGILAGTPITWRPLPTLVISVGMTIVPLLTVAVLSWRSRPVRHQPTAWLAVWCAPLLVAATVAIAGHFFPPGAPTELNLFGWDAQLLYLGLGALAGAALGRHPLRAMRAALLGLLLADLYQALRFAWEGRSWAVPLGGGAYWGSAITASVAAFALARLMGGESVPAPASLAREGTG